MLLWSQTNRFETRESHRVNIDDTNVYRRLQVYHRGMQASAKTRFPVSFLARFPLSLSDFNQSPHQAILRQLRISRLRSNTKIDRIGKVKRESLRLWEFRKCSSRLCIETKQKRAKSCDLSTEMLLFISSSTTMLGRSLKIHRPHSFFNRKWKVFLRSPGKP